MYHHYFVGLSHPRIVKVCQRAINPGFAFMCSWGYDVTTHHKKSETCTIWRHQQLIIMIKNGDAILETPTEYSATISPSHQKKKIPCWVAAAKTVKIMWRRLVEAHSRFCTPLRLLGKALLHLPISDLQMQQSRCV